MWRGSELREMDEDDERVSDHDYNIYDVDNDVDDDNGLRDDYSASWYVYMSG